LSGILLILVLWHLLAGVMLQGAHEGGPFESSLLLVLSDHGQTMGGDHGGASSDETDAVLVALNVGAWAAAEAQARSAAKAGASSAAGPGGTTGGPSDLSCASDSSSAALEEQSEAPGSRAVPAAGPSSSRVPSYADRCAARHPLPLPPRLADGSSPPLSPWLPGESVVAQLDLTATLAALMGLPIPFSNVGAVDETMWAALGPAARSAARSGGSSGGAGAEESEAALIEALIANAWQVGRSRVRGACRGLCRVRPTAGRQRGCSFPLMQRCMLARHQDCHIQLFLLTCTRGEAAEAHRTASFAPGMQLPV
jgi:phosphatidylinositol glycan class O